ncbi:translation elongation factor [Clostridiales bacterium PH28_bin88]|nr:translation elongation factor [Clostridiales bacterium PH28_bin88]
MEYIVVGTAGHVDHGKTVLVKALTGVDTDRLKEEKERGISIELGFAPLVLPSGRRLGLVDVPGHERFIRQMLAGVGGMDLVLLVIAADEGVMPQTREHLDIITLLQVKRGIIVISKVDLVDQDWLELVQEEVREAVRGSVMADAPMVTVSAMTGEGMARLVEELDKMAGATPPKAAAGRTRLPVDRVFSITGFGTVVTGTLWSGTVRVGDTVELLPQGRNARIRTLQVHGDQVEEAVAGQRVAVNLAGVDLEEVERGFVLAQPGTFRPAYRLDAEVHLLDRAERPLSHHDRVRVYLGTSEAFGRVVLLDREEMAPGETAFVQFAMEEPVVGARHDRFVIRSYSPMETIGGGTIIDPDAPKHKRFRPEVLAALAAKMQGSPEELVAHALAEQREQVSSIAELGKQIGLEQPEVAGAVGELAKRGEAVLVPGEGGIEYVLDTGRWQRWLEEVRGLLSAFHRQYPLRPGIPKEELRTRKFARLSAKAFQALLDAWQREGKIKVQGMAAALPEFDAEPTTAQREMLDQVENTLRQGGFQPPAWSEMVPRLRIPLEESEELLHFLIRGDVLVKVTDDLYFHREAVEKAKDLIAAHVRQHGGILLGEARDLLDSSRKYVLPLLEYFDQIKFTKRVGDKRVLY